MPSPNSPSRPPTTLEEEYDATISSYFKNQNMKTGEESTVLVLTSRVSAKTMLIHNAQPIEFELLNGKKTSWVSSWGLIEGTELLVIGDGVSSSLGINNIDGSREYLGIPGPSGDIEERIFALLRENIMPLPTNPYIIVPKMMRLYHLPCYGHV